MDLSWLPQMISLNDCGGDGQQYLELLYERFRCDFIRSKPTIFNPKRWSMKRHPIERGKEATFWHAISDGENEADRIPDMRRCERLCWIRPMIDAYGTERVCCWKTERHGRSRPIIALPDFSFLVILQEAPEHVMLWTAFYVPGTRRRLKYEQDWKNGG